MSWFTKDLFTFFDGLKQNNNREWFQANKKLYETAVKEPFEELVEDIINRIRGDDAGFDIQPKDTIFRINRDVRFSQNKEPYKTNLAANISSTGRKSPDTPGFFIQVGSDESMTGGGVYVVEKEQLYKIRSAIAASPGTFEALIEDKKFKKKYGVIQGEKNKVMPAEFKEAHARQPILANKQFYYIADLKPEVLLQDDLPEYLMEYYYTGKPVNEFLIRALSGA